MYPQRYLLGFAHSNVQPFCLPGNRLLVNAIGILVNEDGKRVKDMPLRAVSPSWGGLCTILRAPPCRMFRWQLAFFSLRMCSEQIGTSKKRSQGKKEHCALRNSQFFAVNKLENGNSLYQLLSVGLGKRDLNQPQIDRGFIDGRYLFKINQVGTVHANECLGQQFSLNLL